jgi:hypothetical protein
MSNVVSNILAATELAFGRNAEWTLITDPNKYTYAPETGDPDSTTYTNTGISVLEGVVGYISICPKYKPNQRTSWHTVKRDVYDSSEDYVIVVNGTSYTTTGESTYEGAVDDLVAQINADIVNPEDARARKVASETDGVLDTVEVYALGNPATATDPVLVVNATTTHSSGVAVAFPSFADADACSARIWVKFKTPTGFPAGMTLPWRMPADGELGTIDDRLGWCEQVAIAAVERLYVEVYDVDKNASDGADVLARATVILGVAIPEEE